MRNIIISIIAVLILCGCNEESFKIKSSTSIEEKEKDIGSKFRNFINDPSYEMISKEDQNIITKEELLKYFSLPKKNTSISSKYYELEKFAFNSIKNKILVKYEPNKDIFNIELSMEYPELLIYFQDIFIDSSEDDLKNPLALFRAGKLSSEDFEYDKFEMNLIWKKDRFHFDFEKKEKINKNTVSSSYGFDFSELSPEDIAERIERDRKKLDSIKHLLSKENIEIQERLINKVEKNQFLKEKIKSDLKMTGFEVTYSTGYPFLNFRWKIEKFYELSGVECYLEYLDESEKVIGFEEIYSCFSDDFSNSKVGKKYLMLTNRGPAKSARKFNLSIKKIRLK